MKRVVAILALICLLLSSFSGCGTGNSEKETKIYSWFNRYLSGAEWNGNHVYSEVYKYKVKDNPAKPDQEREYTGYRMMMRDNTTGEVKSLCVDPLCSHEIGSDCPMVSKSQTDTFWITGDLIFIRRRVRSDEIGASEQEVLSEYNLITGESKTVFAEDMSVSGTSASLWFGEDCLFYIAADVVDGETCFNLTRYSYKNGSYRTIKVFSENMVICLLTDKRIYVGKEPVFTPDLDKLDITSYDYDGKNPREEPSFLISGALYQDTFLIVQVRKTGPILMETPEYMFYDILSRTKYDMPAGEFALSYGYNEADGRFYYVYCEHAEAVFFPLIYSNRAEELGITYEELMADRAECKPLDEQLTKLYHEDKMYLKSCRTDGTDVRVHFEYPAGAVFMTHDNFVFDHGMQPNMTAYATDNRTGAVSADGKWFYVTVATDTGADYMSNHKEARISLETGEIEYP